MLSAADANVVARDALLPGLGPLLDPQAFLDAVRAAAPDVGVRAARPVYLRYKPGTGCLAGYQLDIAGRPEPAYVYARTLRSGDESKLLKMGRAIGGDVPGPLGRGRFLLRDRGILVVAFPNDDALPSLRLTRDDGAWQALLEKVLPGRGQAAGRVELRPLAYKPERRYVGQVVEGDRPLAVLRFYTERGFDAATRNVKAVSALGDVRAPVRLGRSVRNRVVALSWIEGRQLFAALCAGEEEAAMPAVRAAGEAVARLAGHRRRRLAPFRIADEIGAVADVARWVGLLWPPLAERTRALADVVGVRLVSLPVIHRPVHGDFYAKQVLMLDDGGVALVDFDQAALGDPAAELANFAAHLERHAVSHHLPIDLARRVSEVLAQAYETTAGDAVGGRLSAFTAARLLRIVPHFFRAREPDWPARASDLLERAAELLDVARDPPSAATATVSAVPLPPPRHPARVEDPVGAGADPMLPMARVALDIASAEPLILPLLHQAGLCLNGRITGARVTRHKPGRRCLIEYVVEDAAEPPPATPRFPLVVVGKLRAKGVDRRSLEAQRALWSSGFGGAEPLRSGDEHGEDGIRVPQPLGAVPTLGMVVQVKVEGTPAGALIGTPNGPSAARRCAAALRKLHRSGVSPQRPPHGAIDELQLLQERLGRVAAERPQWSERLDRLCTRVSELLIGLGERPRATIHRDFYPDQLLVRDTGEVYLLDLDLFCHGDPALDAGNFVAHVWEQALRSSGDACAFEESGRAFLAAFVDGLPDPAAELRAIHAYRCATLARHVYISSSIPDRRRFTPQLLMLAEEVTFSAMNCDKIR